jgi:Domain of unknown function (DUF4440)
VNWRATGLGSLRDRQSETPPSRFGTGQAPCGTFSSPVTYLALHYHPFPSEVSMVRRCALSIFVAVIFTAGCSVPFCEAQTVPALDKIQNQEELNKAITALDAALFDAYNKCDLQKFGSLVDEDVEFYHDQGGVTLGRAALVESVKKNICATTTRELVAGSLQIYYMKDMARSRWEYTGFIIPGIRRLGTGKGSLCISGSTKDGAWKVTRVLSYDHHAAGK